MCLQLVNQLGVAGSIGGIVSSAREYYSGFLPKRKKREGADRQESPQ